MDIDAVVSDVSERLHGFVAEVEMSVEQIRQELEAARESAARLDLELFSALRMLDRLTKEIAGPQRRSLQRYVAALNTYRDRRGTGEVVTFKDDKLTWKARADA